MTPHEEDEAWRSPTVISLREYVEQRLDSSERTIENARKALAEQVQQRFLATQEAIAADARSVESARKALAEQVQQRFEATEQAIRKTETSVADRLKTVTDALAALTSRVELFITRQEVAVLLEKFDARNAENIQRQLVSLSERSEIQGSAIRKELDLWKEGLREQLRLVNQATDKAAEAMDRRLEGLNEFRQQLRDQSATFITRNEFAAGMSGNQEALARMSESMAGLASRGEIAALAEKIDVLQANQDKAEGRRTVTTALVALSSSLVVSLATGLIIYALGHH